MSEIQIVNPVTGRPYPLQTMVAAGVLLPGFLGNVPTTAPITVNLPPAAAFGTFCALRDITGTAGTNPITINGNGQNIDGAASFVLSINSGIVAFVRDSTQWRRLVARRSLLDGTLTFELAQDAGTVLSTLQLQQGDTILFGSIGGLQVGADGGIRLGYGGSASPSYYVIHEGTQFSWYVGGEYIFAATSGASGKNMASKPRLGMEPPFAPATTYASEGRAVQAMADANQTPGSSVYSRRVIRTTGALTAIRTLSLPDATGGSGNEEGTYEKIIQNDCTGFAVRVANVGGGVTHDVAVGAVHTVIVTPDGVYRVQ